MKVASFLWADATWIDPSITGYRMHHQPSSVTIRTGEYYSCFVLKCSKLPVRRQLVIVEFFGDFQDRAHRGLNQFLMFIKVTGSLHSAEKYQLNVSCEGIGIRPPFFSMICCAMRRVKSVFSMCA